MRVTVKVGQPAKEATEALVIGLFENGLAPQASIRLDEVLGGMIGDLIDSGDFSGKADQSSLLYPRGAIPARRVLVIGLGKKEKFDLETVRQSIGKACSKIQKMGIKRAGKEVVDEVIEAMSSWEQYAEEANVPIDKIESIRRQFRLL